MKSALIALTALVSISSAFADDATLTTRNGVQNLTISGRTRSGIPLPGFLTEATGILLRATSVLKVKRYPDASFYKGVFVSGNASCPAGFCSREITIEQKANAAGPGGNVQRMNKVDAGTYEIVGAAAKELYDALADGGVRVERTRTRMPGTLVSGNSFECSAIPMNGMVYKCTISVNEDLR